jgi:hypothetical protein
MGCGYARLNNGGVKMRKLFFLTIGLLFLSGCATTSYNKAINKEIKLEGLTIHIVSSSDDFDHPKYKGSTTVKGYANGFEVWIVGFYKDDQIHVDSKVLGHEIRHALKARFPELADPDKEDFLNLQTNVMSHYKLPWN